MEVEFEKGSVIKIPNGYRRMGENEIIEGFDLVLWYVTKRWELVDSKDVGFRTYMVGDFCLKKIKR